MCFAINDSPSFTRLIKVRNSFRLLICQAQYFVNETEKGIYKYFFSVSFTKYKRKKKYL